MYDLKRRKYQMIFTTFLLSSILCNEKILWIGFFCGEKGRKMVCMYEFFKTRKNELT
jgi:hypothetical protein